jgi:CBS domain-containing protein
MSVLKILKVKGDGPVVTIEPGATVGDAAKLLSARRIGAVIVSRDGKHVEGILSERDIVREIGKRGSICLGDKVEKAMTRKLMTCTIHDNAVEILQRMTDGRFRHMPVMEGEEIIAVISIGDVVKMRLGELAMENDALEGMIRGN